MGGSSAIQPPPHVVLVGCGQWGRHLLRDLVALGCPVTVVVRDSAESRDRARQGGARNVMVGVENIPEDVAGAVVATPISTHAEVVESLLPLEIPVFCEKPLTTDPVAADRLAELAPDRLFVMDKWRYHPGIELLANIARSGELGPVVGLESTRIGWGRPHSDADAVWALTPHDLAIALEVLGGIPEPRAAVADIFDGEARGLFGLLGTDPWVALRVSSRDQERRRQVTLRCRDGLASLLEGDAGRVIVSQGYPNGDQTAPARAISFEDELPTLRELRAFVEHLMGGPPPRSSAAEGAEIVRAIARLRALAGIET